jgi:HAD superfamily hydrolase (TIGR01450 family)
MPVIPCIRPEYLIERYDALLFDAYGVLLHRDGPLPGACQLLERLHQLGKPYFVVTNSAARLPENAATRYRAFGFPLDPHQIVTAGSLIEPHFRSQGLMGKHCAVLGPEDSLRYVENAGGMVVPPTSAFDVLVIGDQVGFPFLDHIDAAISHLIERFDADNPVHLILPNPDLIFPKPEGFGITCGSMATVIESVLKQRYPDRSDTQFVVLGKPKPAIFEEAARRAGTRNLVMIGDQIETDIRGARAFGIDSALVTGGVAELAFFSDTSNDLPSYQLQSLALSAA